MSLKRHICTYVHMHMYTIVPEHIVASIVSNQLTLSYIFTGLVIVRDWLEHCHTLGFTTPGPRHLKRVRQRNAGLAFRLLRAAHLNISGK